MVLYVTITTPSFLFTFFKHFFLIMVYVTQKGLIFSLGKKRVHSRVQNIFLQKF